MKTILSKISTHKSTKKIKIARYWHRNRHTYVSMKQKIRNSPNTHVSDESDVSKRKWEKLDYSVNDVGQLSTTISEKKVRPVPHQNKLQVNQKIKIQNIFKKSTIKYHGNIFITLE